MTKILVTGLPGSGKTTFSKMLKKELPYFSYINGDEEREKAGDWDFSNDGRIRQTKRIQNISNNLDNSICDFVCPTNEFRDILNANIVVWMNTIDKSKYEDTNKLFENPIKWDYQITLKDNDAYLTVINEIKERLNYGNSETT